MNRMKASFLVGLCSILLAFFAHTTHAQQTSVAQELANHINPFTGDFNYQVPLLNITGPNGENFPIQVNYTAGIKTNQEASWVGLGWDLNIGEIRRQTNGVADDWKDETLEHKTYDGTTAAAQTTETTDFYGPVHFKDYDYLNTGHAMDTYQSDRFVGPGESMFEAPDYDAYFVSGPGISGEINPNLFEYAYMEHKNFSDVVFAGSGNDPYHQAFTQRPTFRFRNEPCAQISAPYYGHSDYDATLNEFATELTYSYLQLATNTAYYAFKTPFNLTKDWSAYDANKITKYTGDYTNTNGENTMWGANYIEYFTNQEIRNHHHYVNGQGGTASDEIDGFLDFEVVAGSGDRDDANQYDPDGIGAFRITNPSGITYHYALPAYSLDEKVSTFDLDDSFNMKTGAGVGELNTYTKNARFAYSWKLTAITGIDYVDANNNGVADAGDTGFWMALDYSLWLDDFKWRSPFYGYHYDLIDKRHPQQYKEEPQADDYGRQGTVTEGTTQLYYLNTIKTATQTAYFVKDVRMDAHDVNEVPKLRLDKIVLLDNDDINGSWFDHADELNPTEYAGLTNDIVENTINAEQYSQDRTAIEAVSLKTVEFAYSYDLCKGVYNNINNTTNTGTVDFGLVLDVYHEVSSQTVTTGGKLTLTSIATYEHAHDTIYPATDFEYNAANPDYNHEQKDYFGYHKRDFDTNVKRGYTTPDVGGVAGSHSAVDAWSLSKIHTPMGSTINVEYESDVYVGVGYNSASKMPAAPERMFRLKDVTFGSNYKWVTLELHDDDGLTILDGPGVNNSSLYFQYTCGNNSNCTEAFNDGNFTGEVDGGVIEAHSAASMCDGCGTTSFNQVNGYGWLKIHLDSVYGGGLRVKEINIEEPVTGERYRLQPLYTEGICTTEPDVFSHTEFGTLKFSKAGGDRHALPPMVGYSNTHLRFVGDNNDLLGSTAYHFNNYRDPFSITRINANNVTSHPDINQEDLTSGYPGFNNVTYHCEVVVCDEDNSNYGQVRKVAHHDKHGTELASTEFEYGRLLDKKARVEEVFFKRFWVDSDDQFSTTFFKRRYQNQLRRKITRQDGLTTYTTYSERDALTGVPTKTVITDPTGPNTTLEVSPAFRNNSYSAMGAKTVDPAYQNILLPVETEKVTRGTVLTAGSHTVWDDEHVYRVYDTGTDRYIRDTLTTIWAPEQTYTYNGEASTANWKQVGELMLMGDRDLVYDQKDMKNYHAASKFGYDNRFKTAAVTNCNYPSFTHTSFESTIDVGSPGGTIYFEGEVSKGQMQHASDANVTAHTGNYVANVGSGKYGPSFKQQVLEEDRNGLKIAHGIHTGRTYRASVWVHEDTPADAKLIADIDGSDDGGQYTDFHQIRKDDANAVKVGEWILLTLTFHLPEDYVSTGGTGNNDVRVYLYNPDAGSTGNNAYFDDFRVHPIDAPVTGYVYDERRGLVTHVLGNENFFTRYEYDDAGTLINTYVETEAGEKITSSISYEFAKDQ